MKSQRELSFWQRHLDKGTIVSALRAHPKRAIRFFGARAVLSENREAILRTLEAYHYCPVKFFPIAIWSR